MKEYTNLKSVLSNFNFDLDGEPYGSGLINRTYIVDSHPSYILQRINTDIFTDPEGLMENIANVTKFLRKKIIEEGGNPDRETITIIPAKDGKSYYKADEDVYFRVYKFVEDSCFYDLPESPELLYNGAKAFGKFQRMLSDYPAQTLHETIPDFHNTRSRFEALKKAIHENKAGRLDSVKDEIEFALSREYMVDIVLDGIKDGEIPLRVTHNDTKFNNVLLDKETKEGLCVIDLDTVMPGSLLYDYGDALRSGGSTGKEDEKDLSKISFNLVNYEYFTKGFLSELKDCMTEREKELIPFSIRLLTFECGIRFLTDYLNGDTYFKTVRPDQNLDRTRTQFKLVSDMESKDKVMNEILEKILSE